MRAKSLSAFIFMCCFYYAVSSEYKELCRPFKRGTQLRKPGSCTEYIKCGHNNTVDVLSCADPNLYDRNKQTCAVVQAPPKECSNPCEGVNGKWVSDPTTCVGYLYCTKGVGKHGYCPSGHHFNEKAQICDFATKSDCIGVPNICELAPDKTKFRDEKDCTGYYECSGGKRARKTCKNTYFDVETGNCIEKSLAGCKNHPYPSNVCGTATKPAPGYKADGATCRGYFFCRNYGIVPDLEPLWGQCPEGLFLSTAKQSCVEPVNALCKFNRCEGRGNVMVLLSKNDCHSYAVCKNNSVFSEHRCKGDMFFDEKLQACVKQIVSYSCCDGQK